MITSCLLLIQIESTILLFSCSEEIDNLKLLNGKIMSCKLRTIQGRKCNENIKVVTAIKYFFWLPQKDASFTQLRSDEDSIISASPMDTFDLTEILGRSLERQTSLDESSHQSSASEDESSSSMSVGYDSPSPGPIVGRVRRLRFASESECDSLTAVSWQSLVTLWPVAGHVLCCLLNLYRRCSFRSINCSMR